MSTTSLADVGVIGMAVMGSNLARNLARHGFTVALYNRTTARTEEMVAAHGHEGAFLPAAELEAFVQSIERPRSIILMVQAGQATDATIEALLPLVDEGDIIIDGGNAYFRDTMRREAYVREHGVHFVGAGISGGEVGALEGPSIMPGGPRESYDRIGPLLEKISAHVDDEPCCTWIGPNGAGHFVKMVHNGIEYADMQLIGEAWLLLSALGLSYDEMADVFAEWNTSDLDSYLIEITAEVLRRRDPRTGQPLLDVIVDQAGMKGTGTWTVQTALEEGIPVETIGAAVFARALSSHTELREAAQSCLTGPEQRIDVPDKQRFIEHIRQALWASKVVSYAQGLDEIRTFSTAQEWNINLAEVARIWRSGCIIRARLLERIRSEYAAADVVSLLQAPSVAEELANYQEGWRDVVAQAVLAGVPIPGFSSALAHYDQVRAPRLNAALTQGLRDYFGAHTYRRIDDEGSFHLNWSTDGQEVAQS